MSLSIFAKQLGLTPTKARQSLQVAGLRKADEDGVAEAVGNLLIYLAQQFNVVRNLTNTQVLILSQELPRRYWRWHIDEFNYVIKEAIAGTWGKVYDRLDPPTVFEWFATYDSERSEQLAAEAESRAAAFKAAEADSGPPTDMTRAYLRLRLELETDEGLRSVIRQALHQPDQPGLALHKQLAESILATREMAKATGPPSEEKEADYLRYKADYIANKVLTQGLSEGRN